ncbi:hypothetical protein KM1_129000 [Entamoeba histolytica HM-3:IMSS]|uniref:Uncharacterized protein n=3 Tax=Entamoeba histolytica TaxID=5759 RepID=B1N320_ENTH1|nr:hypothetical protein EHI_094020 [Entamoeba histolytica HM-1:IMSS]EDS89634.1 hypothetical protein EHI_094020 [Entamoeba histolytica HM-1:IMSS]EMS16409.1 hypothetical protein KM1_129000 [Entamoeba histolytica HM-3:IMSS]GAT93891.1 hypothetical protein CL6EHI_094020 [Entamoeba histolytica]|eukprot:XP_001913586.1 hypothetical protein EHI_094020 [Entamoeba histolytica HM-1:IMSS]
MVLTVVNMHQNSQVITQLTLNLMVIKLVKHHMKFVLERELIIKNQELIASNLLFLLKVKEEDLLNQVMLNSQLKLFMKMEQKFHKKILISKI